MNDQKKETNQPITAAAIIVSAIILAGVMFFFIQSAVKAVDGVNRAIAVQGCYEVTRGTRRADKGDGVNLEEAQINAETLKNCLDLKGFADLQ